MSYNKKNRHQTIKSIVLAVSAIALTALITALGCFFYLSGAASAGLNAAKESGSGAVDKLGAAVRAKCRLNPGDIIDVDKVETVQAPLDLIPENAAVGVSQIKGMLLKHTVEEREFITLTDLMPENAWYEDGDRLIEHNFAEGAVPASVAEGSLIDIKLFSSGEEDSVVVSKAAVISRNANLLAFYLNGREQEYLKESASEGMLFAVCYIDEAQKESSVTYIPLYDKKTKK